MRDRRNRPAVTEKTGNIESSREQGRRPLAMSRHRFLMLGASIVGVGMLPFAQRNYAYAASNVSTDDYSDAQMRADPKRHTEILRNMFTDGRLTPPYQFTLKSNPVTRDWWVDMASSGFTAFPVKSEWTLTGSTLSDGTPDPSAGLYRYGRVVNGRRMFQNTDTTEGNDHITFQHVYVDGRKFAAAIEYTFPGSDRTPNPKLGEKTAGNRTKFNYQKHFYDIDLLVTFVRIGQNPNLELGPWNNYVNFVGCKVKDWPGISCEFRQVNGFDVSGNTIESSHRGSLIFRIGARNGSVDKNIVINGGDDCIAFNGNVGAFSDWPSTGGAAGVTLTRNTLGEKQGQDIREPAGYRHRSGNSPVAIRHATGPVNVKESTVTQTEDGYTDWEGGEHSAQPAVEVGESQGFTTRNVYIDGLYVGFNSQGEELPIGAPALSVPDPGVTGGIARGRVTKQYTGSSSPWQIAPPPDLFYRTDLEPPELTPSEETNLTPSEEVSAP
jgi:hypothetical protein